MINVAIIDDHPICARGLELVCKSIPDVNVSGVYYSLKSFSEADEGTHLDLLILDMQLPACEGSHCKIIKELKITHPDTKILSVSESHNVRDRIKAFRSGAQGYMNKCDTLESLRHTIEKTTKIKQCFHSSIAPDESLSSDTFVGEARQYASLLTAAEIRVLIGILNGSSLSSIASRHGLSVKTISSQKRSMMKRCGVKNDIELFQKFKASLKQ